MISTATATATEETSSCSGEDYYRFWEVEQSWAELGEFAVQLSANVTLNTPKRRKRFNWRGAVADCRQRYPPGYRVPRAEQLERYVWRARVVSHICACVSQKRLSNGWTDSLEDAEAEAETEAEVADRNGKLGQAMHRQLLPQVRPPLPEPDELTALLRLLFCFLRQATDRERRGKGRGRKKQLFYFLQHIYDSIFISLLRFPIDFNFNFQFSVLCIAFFSFLSVFFFLGFSDTWHGISLKTVNARISINIKCAKCWTWQQTLSRHSKGQRNKQFRERDKSTK